MIILIVAVDKDWRIGSNNKIPWKCLKDQKFFRETTKTCLAGKTNAIIMGKNTFLDCGILKGRKNIVVSKSLIPQKPPQGEPLEVFPTLKSAINAQLLDKNVDKIFICGGRGIYKEAITEDYCDVALVSRIGDKYLTSFTYVNDIFFPKKEFLQYFLEKEPFNASLDFQVVEFAKLSY